jgi:glycosyltransferase involved in cell wall biosynthesis
MIEAPKFSIIIPAFQSADVIRSCLNSLMLQIEISNAEIIVVESSGDGTTEIIKNEYPDVILIESEVRLFPGAARNKAFQLARGELLVLLDAHCVACDDWLSKIQGKFENPDINVLGGSRALSPHASIFEQLQARVEFGEFQPFLPFRIARILPAGNTTFRRNIIEKFSYSKLLRSAEDVVMSDQLTRAGHTLYFDPKVMVTYEAKKSWASCVKHLYGLGFHSALARREYDLSGSWLVKFRIIALLLLPYRIVKFYGLNFRFNPSAIPWLILVIPVYLFLFSAWTLGFYIGLSPSSALGLKNSIEYREYRVTI